jgi:hypothetical protein
MFRAKYELKGLTRDQVEDLMLVLNNHRDSAEADLLMARKTGSALAQARAQGQFEVFNYTLNKLVEYLKTEAA